MSSQIRRTSHAKRGLRFLIIVLFQASFLVFRLCPISGNSTKQSASHKSTTSTKAAGFAEVEKYCAEVRARSSKREPDFVLGRPSSTEDHKAQWQRYLSSADLEKAVESAQVIYDEQVYVWTEGGSVIAANFTLQDGSGDWTLYPDYCFRKNGTTAEISSELRTFFGMMLVLRNWKFDSNGRLLESKERFLDLDT